MLFRSAEGLDPDDPAVIAAIDLVRWELCPLMGDDGSMDENEFASSPLGQ